MVKNRYLKSLLSATLSILPIVLIIVILSVIPGPNAGLIPGWGDKLVCLKNFDYLALGICAVILILGLSGFQIGAAGGLTKVGEYMGASLSRQKHLFIVIVFAFLLGALITCAEPSIIIVAGQCGIPTVLLISSIAIGVGIFVVFGVLRIIFHKSLKLWYLLFYFIVFCLICFVGIDPKSRQFLPFIFDAGGITTGSATVPFILALGAGVAAVRGGRTATEDSFGIVGIASIGPILSMTLVILVKGGNFDPYVVPPIDHFDTIGEIFGKLGTAFLPHGENSGTLIDVAFALLPIIVIFTIYNFIFIKLPKAKVLELVYGFVVSFLGLSVFLAGINAFMQPFGNLVGQYLGFVDNGWIIILICFLIGLVTILCEPAVHVLTTQISVVSDGRITKKTVMISLCLGVGIAIGLAAVRTVFNFNILYIIVPGYLLSILLMFVCPTLYTALAFDSGGTASGPMSVSFVLPMLIGITYTRSIGGPEPQYYEQSFGVVSLIAMTPIIAIQMLGLVTNIQKLQQLRILRKSQEDVGDAEIIRF